MRHLPLALAQFNTRLGDVDANLERHVAFADDARRQGAELVVFPEFSLTGYVLQDLAVSVARLPLLCDGRTGLMAREPERILRRDAGSSTPGA